MNDDMMFEYLLQMGAMQPEQMELLRKQKQVEALRSGAMNSPQGQMVGKHYVPPSLTQYAAQLGQGVMANMGQKDVDTGMRDMNEKQRVALERIKRQKKIQQLGGFDTSVLGENY